jgi:hypothetical protein
MHEVRERLVSVDRNDWNTLSVPTLQLRVASDVDLFELERDLFAHLFQNPAGALAEMTAGRLVERNPTDTGL